MEQVHARPRHYINPHDMAREARRCTGPELWIWLERRKRTREKARRVSDMLAMMAARKKRNSNARRQRRWRSRNGRQA